MPAPPPRASFPSADDAPGLMAALRHWALLGAGLMKNNRLARFVTLEELQGAGVINVREAGAGRAPGAGGAPTGPGGRPIIVEPAFDPTPPPPPGGFQAISGITQIMFITANPVYRQGGGHARTKVYAAPWDGVSPLPTFANAVLYTDFPGNVGTAPFEPASNLRLWATWVSAHGKESDPAGGINGIAAVTGLLEDQHISNLTVGKLLAGSIAVSQYIQSADYVANTAGFRLMTTAGGQAFLEINGGAFIGGLVVGATFIQSSNYILNTQGYRLNANGTGQIGGFVVDTNAIRSSNYIAGTQGWRLAFDGTGQLRLATIDAISANLGTITAGVLRNSTDSVNMNLNATGAALLFRAGPLTNYGPYAGNHYKVEIYADGLAFFGREVVAGGTLKASGTGYAIPDKDRPAVLFQTVTDIAMGGT